MVKEHKYPKRFWAVDAPYTKWNQGWLRINAEHGVGLFDADLVVEGDVKDLTDAIVKPDGDVREFLALNNYQTKITEIEIYDINKAERRYLTEFGKKHGIKMDIELSEEAEYEYDEEDEENTRHKMDDLTRAIRREIPRPEKPVRVRSHFRRGKKIKSHRRRKPRIRGGRTRRRGR